MSSILHRSLVCVALGTWICRSASADDVVHVLIARPETRIIEDCDDGVIRVRTQSNRSIMINGRPIISNSLKAALDDIYRTRAERAVYVESDADVSFASIASVMAVLKSIPNLYIVLVTDKIRSARCFTFKVR
jgi:biopolymer transport protein ExbD